MKDIGVNYGQNVSQDSRRHVGGITLLKEGHKEIIEADIHCIPKNGIPNADKDETDLCLCRINQN